MSGKDIFLRKLPWDTSSVFLRKLALDAGSVFLRNLALDAGFMFLRKLAWTTGSIFLREGHRTESLKVIGGLGKNMRRQDSSCGE